MSTRDTIVPQSGGSGGAEELDDLTDVNAGSPSDNEFLVYDSATGKWIDEAPPLGDLGNVDTTGATPGQVLSWDGANWVPSTTAASPNPSTTLPLDLGTPSIGTSLLYSREDHVHQVPDVGELADVNVVGATDGQVLAYNSGTGDWESTTIASGLYENIQYVNEGVNDVQDGLNLAAVGDTVSVGPGNFPGATVTVSTSGVRLTGYFHAEGTTNTQLGTAGTPRDLFIGPTSSGTKTIGIQITGDTEVQGSSQWFESCQLRNLGGGTNIVRGASGFVIFKNSEIAGMTIDATTTAIVYFIDCDLQGVPIVNSAPGGAAQVIVSNCANVDAAQTGVTLVAVNSFDDGTTRGFLNTVYLPNLSASGLLSGFTGQYSEISGTPTIPTAGAALPQDLGVASAGAASAFSREDHVHDMPSLGELDDVDTIGATNGQVIAYNSGTGDWELAAAPASPSSALPQDLGTASAGASLDYSRADHVHDLPALDGLEDVNAPTPSNGQVLSYNSGSGDWEAATLPTPPAAGTNLPQDLGTAAVGVATAYSREDHVHDMPTLTQLEGVNAPSPSNNQVLAYNSSSGDWEPANNGDVSGPGTSTNFAVTLWQGTSGDALRDSSLIYSSAAGYIALSTTSNDDLILEPAGTGSLQRSTGGDSRGLNATDLQAIRSASTQVASGQEATIGGGRQNTASGLRSVVAGGQNNRALAYRSTVSGGTNNTASAERATVAGGDTCAAAALDATVSGGQSNSVVGIGGTVPGGSSNRAEGDYSQASGYSALTSLYGERTVASGRFSSRGDAQCSTVVARNQTAPASPSAQLYLDGAAERIVLPDNSGYRFHIKAIARDTSGNDSAWWDIQGCITRNVGAATVAIIGANVVMTSSTAGAAAWTLTATAVNGALQLDAAAGGGVTVRWVATVEITKVAY